MKSKRCIICKKRHIPNMTCQKCNQTTCIRHINCEDHNCTYNFSIEGKKQLEKENQQIIKEKITLI